MKQYSLLEHFGELKTRLLRVLIIFLISFIICYYFKEVIYGLLIHSLVELGYSSKIIYTSLTEAFFTYINMAAFAALIMTLPVISLECYLFITPGLYIGEKKIAAFVFFMSPILFCFGAIFVFYFVIPRAWYFFLSFENDNLVAPLVLEAKISEYVRLIVQLIIAFGVCFQLPVIMLILNLLKITDVASFKKKRRLSIVLNFVIAGILTPPDVLSQFALAVPMILLYEISIFMCQFMERRKDVRYKMDS